MVNMSPDIGLIVTSHSIDGTYESCARRFEFLHFYLRAPEKESDAYAADVGTALHEGTQAWQRSLFEKESSDLAERRGTMEFMKWWPWEIEESRRRESKPIGVRTLGNALLLLDAIMESNWWDDWEVVEVTGFGPAIEVPWRIVHKSLGLVATPYGTQAYLATQGKIDFILRHKRTGAYRVVDLKTTEKARPAHYAAFRFSGQAGLYGLILAHALGHDWKNEGLTVTYLLAMFGEDGAPDVYPINYKLDPEEIQDSIDVKIERLEKMKEYATRRHWPRRSHGCEFFGRPCGFLDICERRDESYLKNWFEFEIEAGRFQEYKRVYEPVWTLEA